VSTAKAAPDVQVRGILPERIVVSTTLDPYLPLKALATYSGMCVRTLRDCLVDPFRPLPHYRYGGKILVRRSEFDTWISAYRRVGSPDVEGIVDDVFAGLR
jgi:hypothetical protein